jgi:hypothetical protein
MESTCRAYDQKADGMRANEAILHQAARHTVVDSW